MGSACVTTSRTRTAITLHTLIVAAFALAGLATSGSAIAAPKGAEMCGGLKGQAKGLCTAAAALGCGESANHQGQCDTLGDKYVAATGEQPPWEEQEPPEEPLLLYDAETFSLIGGEACVGRVIECDVDEPTDFWIEPSPSGDSVILVPIPADMCVPPADVISAVVFVGAPFESITLDMIDRSMFTDTVLQISFSANDTLVLRNCEGTFWKIGNLEVVSDGANFEFAFLGQ